MNVSNDHFWPSLIGGSSHPCGPKCGITIDCPSLFLNGFEYVHSDLPSVDNQEPFTTVKPLRSPVDQFGDSSRQETYSLTL